MSCMPTKLWHSVCNRASPKKRISHFKMWHLVTIMIPCVHYDFIILMHSSFKTFFFSFSTCACNIFLDDTFVLKQKQCRFPEENLKCFPVADISEKHSDWSETGARALNTPLILLPAQLWSFFFYCWQSSFKSIIITKMLSVSSFLF